MKCIYCKNKLTMIDMVNDTTLECPSCGTHQDNKIEPMSVLSIEELDLIMKYIFVGSERKR